MKALLLIVAFSFTCFITVAGKGYLPGYRTIDTTKKQKPDSVQLTVDGEHVYYQKAIKVDSTIRESQIFSRTLQFMAAKNFQQNYGYQQEGKLIFTTTQDLNINLVYVGDDNDAVNQYTVQFSITVDMKNGVYRYTIDNVVFFIPFDTGNRRETMDDIYRKATNTESRRVAKEAKRLIDSFDRYLNSLTNQLYEGIEQKSLIYKSKF